LIRKRKCKEMQAVSRFHGRFVAFPQRLHAVLQIPVFLKLSAFPSPRAAYDIGAAKPVAQAGDGPTRTRL